jgi:hypothetical protein
LSVERCRPEAEYSHDSHPHDEQTIHASG